MRTYTETDIIRHIRFLLRTTKQAEMARQIGISKQDFNRGISGTKPLPKRIIAWMGYSPLARRYKKVAGDDC